MVLGPVARVTSRTVIAGTDALLASDMARTLIDRVLAGPLVDRIGTGIAEREVLERVVAPSVENGSLDKLVADSLASPVTERIAAEVIDSELVDLIVARLLESDDLWLLVDEIARSPSVTAAISQQGFGLADQFADVVRNRSERADDRLEGVVKRLLRRNGHAPAELVPDDGGDER